MKKGFTIIELLSVIIILALISAFTIPIVLNSREGAVNKISEQERKNLIEASKMVAIDLDDYLSKIYNCSGWISEKCTKENNNWITVTITVGDLIDNGYFEDNHEHFNREQSVTITNDYTVTINE